MKNIIIVGTGKAGLLHYNSYLKIKEKGNVYFVDKNKIIKNENIKEYNGNIYSKIEDVILMNKLDVRDVIVDICTPKEAFGEIINQCKRINITNILIEKPFVVEKDFFEKNPELNIIMVQNYLHSCITKQIKNIIQENNLKIKYIYTNFSKNRIDDSFKGRGMNSITTNNIEVEIPHQLYIANYLLDNPKTKKILFFEEKNIAKDGKILKNHGYGKIIIKEDDAIIFHESDLTTNMTIREVDIICENSITIHAEYLIYNSSLNRIKDGKIIMNKEEDKIFEKSFMTDDNMLECIKNAYNYFNSEEKEQKYQEQILYFSDYMNSLYKTMKKNI